ncbi:unnamed protein product, partial [Rotaria sp. Silwood2]
ELCFEIVRDFYTIDQSTNAIISIRIKANSDKYLLLKQNILAKYPRTITQQDLVDAHLYLIKKSCLDIAICSNYLSFRKKFLPEMIQRMATGQPLEDLISTSANVTMVIKQKATNLDNHADLTRGYVNLPSNCYSVSNLPTNTEWTLTTNVYSPVVSNAMIVESREELKFPSTDSITTETPSEITSSDKSPINGTDMKTEFVNSPKKQFKIGHVEIIVRDPQRQ